MDNKIKVDKVAVCDYYNTNTSKTMFGLKFRETGKRKYNGYNLIWMSDKKSEAKEWCKKIQENISKVKVINGSSKQFYCSLNAFI